MKKREYQRRKAITTQLILHVVHVKICVVILWMLMQDLQVVTLVLLRQEIALSALMKVMLTCQLQYLNYILLPMGIEKVIPDYDSLAVFQTLISTQWNRTTINCLYLSIS